MIVFYLAGVAQLVERRIRNAQVGSSILPLGSGIKFFKIMDTKDRILEIETMMLEADFWVDKGRAQSLVKELKRLKSDEKESNAEDRGAILTILAGAGGDDAEDFARMLLEMYLKYSKQAGVEAILLHENTNDHGGYRNVTIELFGHGVYARLKNESGVHRLVRISPFNAKKLRHTSFALVEFLPKIPKEDLPSIPETEISVDFARSSGPGGQNVNKRETAVRLVHLPTGLSVHVSSERSQGSNREKAMFLLQNKLHAKMQKEREAKERGLQLSSTTQIEWGNQIRSYVLHPYKLIKDHRSGVETSKVEQVLNGEIEIFLTQVLVV